MKKTLLMLGACSLLTFSSFATKWRVNNTPGVNANFVNIQDAMTAAANGDTIYVEPSVTIYSNGSLYVNKPIVIIGNGYFTNNQFLVNNIGLQANMQDSKFNGTVYIEPTGAGATVMGMTFQGPVFVYTNNITLKRNLFSSSTLYLANNGGAGFSVLNNLDIRQNLFIGQSNYSGVNIYNFSTTGGGSFSNVSIQNNIFNGYYCGIQLPVGISGFIQNNVFDQSSLNTFGFQVDNNLMVGGATFTSNNCVSFNNIGSGTQFGNANNNQQNITTTALFTNYSGATETETRYTLSATSPAIGAGFNGVDVGIFGGPDPYKLSGIPPVPTIYSLTAPATTTTTTLPVTISTRSND